MPPKKHKADDGSLDAEEGVLLFVFILCCCSLCYVKQLWQFIVNVAGNFLFVVSFPLPHTTYIAIIWWHLLSVSHGIFYVHPCWQPFYLWCIIHHLITSHITNILLAFFVSITHCNFIFGDHGLFCLSFLATFHFLHTLFVKFVSVSL